MVMMAIYSSWSAILRGSRSGLAAAAEVQRARVTIHSLEESLGSALLYADNIKYYAFFADTSTEFAYLSFVARLPQSFPGSGLFPGQDLRRVVFEVDADRTLLLRQSPLLEATDQIEQPYTIKLAPDVSLFAVEFFDARANEWIPEWGYTNQLPRMMRVALGFGKDGNNPQRVTMRTIPLNSIAITRIGAAGTGPGGAGGGAGVPGGGGVQPGGPGGERGERGEREERGNRGERGPGGQRGSGNKMPPPSFGAGGNNQQGWQAPFGSRSAGMSGGSGSRNPAFPPGPR